VAQSVFLWAVVATFIFQGTSALALDTKWRFAVPARHREVLAATANSQVTLTKHPDGCLMMFPRPAWETFRDRIAAQPMGASGWKRVFLGSAQDVDLDGSGRVLVAPELRTWAGLENEANKNIKLIGLGSYFEIWDAEKYDDQEAKVMASEMPDSFKDFSF
jgi:MraZ protein